MSDEGRKLPVYRVALAAALALIAAMALALRSVPPPAAPQVAVVTAANPSSSAATTTPTQVTVVDVGALIAELDRVTLAKNEVDRTVFQTRGGSVSLRALTYRQLDPLHLERVTHQAILPIGGELELTSFAVDAGVPVAVVERPSPTTLVSVPPYTAQQWENVSEKHVGVLLNFRTNPADDPTYLKPMDSRIALGGPIARLDATGGAAPKDLLLGRLEVVAVSKELQVAAPGATILYVVKGKGQLTAGAAHPLIEKSMAFVPSGVAAQVTADPAAPLSLLIFHPDRDDVSEILSKGHKLYSQDNEELVIRDFFQDRREGSWVDIGAGDWKSDSTTLYLEEKLGWSGVSVDARSTVAPGYAEHRHHTRFANYLITDRARGTQKFYQADDYPEVSSTDRRVAEDEEKTFLGNTKITELEVPSIAMDELLDKMKVSSFDFLSMDIEEHEPDALGGFSVEKFHPQLVCIEAHRGVADPIFKYFHDHGYRRLDKYLHYDDCNWYFTLEK